MKNDPFQNALFPWSSRSYQITKPSTKIENNKRVAVEIEAVVKNINKELKKLEGLKKQVLEGGKAEINGLVNQLINDSSTGLRHQLKTHDKDTPHPLAPITIIKKELHQLSEEELVSIKTQAEEVKEKLFIARIRKETCWELNNLTKLKPFLNNPDIANNQFVTSNLESLRLVAPAHVNTVDSSSLTVSDCIYHIQQVLIGHGNNVLLSAYLTRLKSLNNVIRQQIIQKNFWNTYQGQMRSSYEYDIKNSTSFSEQDKKEAEYLYKVSIGKLSIYQQIDVIARIINLLEIVNYKIIPEKILNNNNVLQNVKENPQLLQAWNKIIEKVIPYYSCSYDGNLYRLELKEGASHANLPFPKIAIRTAIYYLTSCLSRISGYNFFIDEIAKRYKMLEELTSIGMATRIIKLKTRIGELKLTNGEQNKINVADLHIVLTEEDIINRIEQGALYEFYNSATELSDLAEEINNQAQKKFNDLFKKIELKYENFNKQLELLKNKLNNSNYIDRDNISVLEITDLVYQQCQVLILSHLKPTYSRKTIEEKIKKPVEISNNDISKLSQRELKTFLNSLEKMKERIDLLPDIFARFAEVIKFHDERKKLCDSNLVPDWDKDWDITEENTIAEILWGDSVEDSLLNFKEMVSKCCEMLLDDQYIKLVEYAQLWKSWNLWKKNPNKEARSFNANLFKKFNEKAKINLLPLLQTLDGKYKWEKTLNEDVDFTKVVLNKLVNQIVNKANSIEALKISGIKGCRDELLSKYFKNTNGILLKDGCNLSFSTEVLRQRCSQGKYIAIVLHSILEKCMHLGAALDFIEELGKLDRAYHKARKVDLEQSSAIYDNLVKSCDFLDNGTKILDNGTKIDGIEVKTEQLSEAKLEDIKQACTQLIQTKTEFERCANNASNKSKVEQRTDQEIQREQSDEENILGIEETKEANSEPQTTQTVKKSATGIQEIQQEQSNEKNIFEDRKTKKIDSEIEVEPINFESQSNLLSLDNQTPEVHDEQQATQTAKIHLALLNKILDNHDDGSALFNEEPVNVEPGEKYQVQQTERAIKNLLPTEEPSSFNDNSFNTTGFNNTEVVENEVLPVKSEEPKDNKQATAHNNLFDKFDETRSSKLIEEYIVAQSNGDTLNNDIFNNSHREQEPPVFENNTIQNKQTQSLEKEQEEAETSPLGIQSDNTNDDDESDIFGVDSSLSKNADEGTAENEARNTSWLFSYSSKDETENNGSEVTSNVSSLVTQIQPVTQQLSPTAEHRQGSPVNDDLSEYTEQLKQPINLFDNNEEKDEISESEYDAKQNQLPKEKPSTKPPEGQQQPEPNHIAEDQVESPVATTKPKTEPTSTKTNSKIDATNKKDSDNSGIEREDESLSVKETGKETGQFPSTKLRQNQVNIFVALINKLKGPTNTKTAYTNVVKALQAIKKITFSTNITNQTIDEISDKKIRTQKQFEAMIPKEHKKTYQAFHRVFTESWKYVTARQLDFASHISEAPKAKTIATTEYAETLRNLAAEIMRCDVMIRNLIINPSEFPRCLENQGHDDLFDLLKSRKESQYMPELIKHFEKQIKQRYLACKTAKENYYKLEQPKERKPEKAAVLQPTTSTSMTTNTQSLVTNSIFQPNSSNVSSSHEGHKQHCQQRYNELRNERLEKERKKLEQEAARKKQLEERREQHIKDGVTMFARARSKENPNAITFLAGQHAERTLLKAEPPQR